MGTGCGAGGPDTTTATTAATTAAAPSLGPGVDMGMGMGMAMAMGSGRGLVRLVVGTCRCSGPWWLHGLGRGPCRRLHMCLVRLRQGSEHTAGQHPLLQGGRRLHLVRVQDPDHAQVGLLGVLGARAQGLHRVGDTLGQTLLLEQRGQGAQHVDQGPATGPGPPGHPLGHLALHLVGQQGRALGLLVLGSQLRQTLPLALLQLFLGLVTQGAGQ